MPTHWASQHENRNLDRILTSRIREGYDHQLKGTTSVPSYCLTKSLKSLDSESAMRTAGCGRDHEDLVSAL